MKLKKLESIKNKDREFNFLAHWKGYRDEYDQ